MRLVRTSPLFLRRLITVVAVFSLFAVSFSFLIRNAEAVPTFQVSPPVAVNTATGSQLWPAWQQSSCSYLNFFYVFWVDPAGPSLFYSSSTDGQTWIAPVNALTLTGMGTGTLSSTAAAMAPFQLACNGNAVVVMWSTVNAGVAWAGQTNFIKYTTGSLSGGAITFGSVTTGPKTANGNTYHAGTFATAGAYGCLGWLNTHVFFCVNSFGAGGAWSMFKDGLSVSNNTFSTGTNYNSIWWNGAAYMVYQAANCNVYTSGDGSTWSAAVTISATFCSTGTKIGANEITGYNGIFYLDAFKTGTGMYLLSLSSAGALLSSTLLTSTAFVSSEYLITTDGNGNFVDIICAASLGGICYYFVTNNTWTTFTSSTLSFTGGDLGASAEFWSISTGPLFSSVMEAFSVTTVTTASPFFVYATVFGIPLTATTSTQTQTVGSCPVKNTATFTMANNTIYLYAGNALGQEVVNTVQVDVASITGSGSHTLELVIYVGTQQSINVNTPSTLAFQYTKTFSTGTTNQQFTVQVNIPLNTAAAAPLPFNWWAVGVIGDNHIVLNQSSLAGLQTVTGSAPPANQPLSFTALSANANKIALCATASYQSFVSNTVTTTAAASTTTTASTTITSTISTIGASLFTTSSNWPVIFLILLLPAGLFLGVTKNIAGALLGLMIGAIMGTMMGILPGWAFIGIVIALAAVAFIARERG